MTAAYFKGISHHIPERDTLRYQKNRKNQFFIGKNKEKKSTLNYFCYVEMLGTLDIIMSKKEKILEIK